MHAVSIQSKKMLQLIKMTDLRAKSQKIGGIGKEY